MTFVGLMVTFVGLMVTFVGLVVTSFGHRRVFYLYQNVGIGNVKPVFGLDPQHETPTRMSLRSGGI